MKKTIEVKATRLGYYNHQLIEEGTVFDMALDEYRQTLDNGDEVTCSWAVPTEEELATTPDTGDGGDKI